MSPNTTGRAHATTPQCAAPESAAGLAVGVPRIWAAAAGARVPLNVPTTVIAVGGVRGPMIPSARAGRTDVASPPASPVPTHIDSDAARQITSTTATVAARRSRPEQLSADGAFG